MTFDNNVELDENNYDEDDLRQTSTFGINGSCILKTGTASKADAEYYFSANQKQLFCGIITETQESGTI